MKFDCSKYLDKCKACCCGAVPIEKEIYEKNKCKIQIPKNVITQALRQEFTAKDPLTKKDVELVMVITDDCKCQFLTHERRCAIEDDKPSVCKRFGNESHPALRCIYQDKDGRERSRQERRKIERGKL